MPHAPSPLNYSPDVIPVHRRPLVRIAVLTLLLVTLAHIARRYLPLLNHDLSTYSAQRACLAYAPPPNHLLYDSAADAYYALPRQPGYALFPAGTDKYGPFALNPTLHTYLALRTSDHDARPFIAAAFPFLHARAAAPGHSPRLVVVRFRYDTHGGRTYTLAATAEPAFSPFAVPPSSDLTCYDPAGCPFLFRLRRTDHLRLYAGSPDPADPADPARFTIPLTINDTPYTLDGRLTPSGAVTLTPRTGPTTQTPTGPVWLPTNAPEWEPIIHLDLPY